MRIAIVVTGAERTVLAKLAKTYDCDVPQLAKVAVEELIAAHRRRRATVTPPSRRRRAAAPPAAAVVPPKPPVPSLPQPGRQFSAKPCAACGQLFVPTGPRSKVCAPCKATFTADPPAPEVQLETVWNGTLGRQGVSLGSR